MLTSAPLPAGGCTWPQVRRWLLAYVLPVVAFLIFWQGATEWWRLARPAIFSSPSRIFGELLQWYGTGAILQPLATTLGEALAGLVLALVIGICLGIAVGWYRWLDALTDPTFTLLYSVPVIIFAVILRYLVGIGPAVPVITAFVASLWPIVFNVAAGMKGVSPQHVTMARIFGANDRQVFTTIALPTIVPYVTSILRIAVGRALGGAIVGEFMASTGGAGYIMFNAASNFGMSTVIVFALTIIAVSLILQQGINMLEARFSGWRMI